MSAWNSTWTVGLALLATAVSISSITVFGCGMNDELEASPAPRAMADAGTGRSDASYSADARPEASKPDVGPTVRTIIRRSPFGRLDPNNLMLDGDFEMSALDTMQYVWFGMDQESIAVGSTCRSGVRCLRLGANQYVAGAFVWPNASWMSVWFYAKPAETDSCKDSVAAAIVPLDGNGPQLSVNSVGEEREDGWCRYESTVSIPKDIDYHLWGIVLAARPGISTRVIFDDVVAHQAGAPAFSTRKQHEPPPDVRKLIDDAVRGLRDKLPGKPRPRHIPVDDFTGRRKTYETAH